MNDDEKDEKDLKEFKTIREELAVALHEFSYELSRLSRITEVLAVLTAGGPDHSSSSMMGEVQTQWKGALEEMDERDQEVSVCMDKLDSLLSRVEARTSGVTAKVLPFTRSKDNSRRGRRQS